MFDYVDGLIILIFLSGFVIKSIIMKAIFGESFRKNLLKKENIILISIFFLSFILLRVFLISKNIYLKWKINIILKNRFALY